MFTTRYCRSKWPLIILCLLPFPALANKKSTPDIFVVNYRAESIELDGLHQYYLELIGRALDVTWDKYGDYELKPVFSTNWVRAKRDVINNNIENYLIGASFSKKIAADLTYIPLPIDLGIMSYRVCFTSDSKVLELSKVTTLKQLKMYSIGQGAGWLDVGVLRANGFEVIEFPNIDSLFPSVARGRFDLFCRSANEILPEWRTHKDIHHLAVEQSFVLYYSFPRFFWTNPSNTELLERMTAGMTTILQDGTALKIWLKHNEENVRFAKLSARRLFRLENPQIEGIANTFEQYFYDPMK